MKSGIRLLCLLLCIILLVSCGQQPKGNTEPESAFHEELDINKDEISILAPPTEIERTYKAVKNMFTGKLISYKYDEGFNLEYRYGTITLEIEVDGTYKGDYLPGQTVVEKYEYETFITDEDNLDFWEEGQRYLFMLGIDEDMTYSEYYGYSYEPSEEEISLFKRKLKSDALRSKHRVLKLDNEGNYELIDGSVECPCHNEYKSRVECTEHTGTKNKIYHFFDYMHYLGSRCSIYFGVDWSQFEDFFPNPEDRTLENIYETAEDVYFGECFGEINKIIINEDGSETNCYVAKVKVMTVYKGNLKPGETVFDVTNARIDSGKRFFFTGGILDRGLTPDDFPLHAW